MSGSKTVEEICQNINDTKKTDIKPSQIDLIQKIKKTGTYNAKVNLHAEVQAKIHIEVVEEEKAKN